MLEPLTVPDAYREEIEIANDIRLRLRFIQPADKKMLTDGFQRLSAESIYRRFFQHKTVLSERELRFFTEVDGISHVAIGAFELDKAGNEQAIVGSARFVRLEDEPDSAEFSVTITDDRQGKGIGRLLLERLLDAAAERGVKYFHSYLLPENERMFKLIKHIRENAVFSTDSGVITARFPVVEDRGLSTLLSAVPMPENLFDLPRLVSEEAMKIFTAFWVLWLLDANAWPWKPGHGKSTGNEMSNHYEENVILGQKGGS